MSTDESAAVPQRRLAGVLEPMDRISEILFGLIMALTFTGTLGVLTADRLQVMTMVIGTLGCNLAWGIIDGGVYLLARLNEQGRRILLLRAAQDRADPGRARAIIADAMPPLIAALLPAQQLEALRQGLLHAPTPAAPNLTARDWLGAVAIAALCFVATFPIVIPFLVVDDARLALRLSNLVAVAMMFLCGWAYGSRCGLRPWRAGLAMVLLGGTLVAVAIVLGG